MRTLLAILFFALIMTACLTDSKSIFESENQPLHQLNSLRVLALGDSYTIGQSVAEKENWPNQLSDSLRHNHTPVKELHIIARTGWTTGNLLNAVNSQSFNYSYDLVGLLIGVNNQFQGRSLSEYEEQFRQLLDIAIALADSQVHRVFVLSIPDYTVTPVGSQFNRGNTPQQIDAFNAVNRRLAEERSVSYFDITPLSRSIAGHYDFIASDGLHFSGKMYAAWVGFILPDILNLLEPNT
jgi:acyl-CoA thioesterase I